MQIKIGEKIRELRRRDGRTQEQLAVALGVTCQAVSRWESGGGYPDMEAMPAIANYFHVTIDELFGYDGDREDRIEEILDSADEVMRKYRSLYRGGLPPEFEECVNTLRAAAAEFPNEPKILKSFAQALVMWGWHVYGARVYSDDKSGVLEFNVEYNSKNIYWQEAVRVYENLLSFSLSASDRETVIRQIVPLYCRMGEYEKAKILAENQNSVAVSKEMLLPEATVGEEKNRYHSERIVELLSKLRASVFEYVSLRKDIHCSEYGKQVILSVINMYESIFNDGRFGSHHWDMGHLYLQMAHYESSCNGKMQDVLAYFDKGFEHYKEYERICNMEEYKYSAPLISSLKPQEKGKLAPMGKNFWKQTLLTYPNNLLEELRKNEKYAECFE